MLSIHTLKSPATARPASKWWNFYSLVNSMELLLLVSSSSPWSQGILLPPLVCSPRRRGKITLDCSNGLANCIIECLHMRHQHILVSQLFLRSALSLCHIQFGTLKTQMLSFESSWLWTKDINVSLWRTIQTEKERKDLSWYLRGKDNLDLLASVKMY